MRGRRCRPACRRGGRRWRLAPAIESGGRRQRERRGSQDGLAAARLSAQATLAQTHLAMRAAEAQQAVQERSAAAYQRSLDITQDRYAAGVAGRSDVLQAETQLKTVKAQAGESALQRAQYEHAIAVLLGQPPAELTIERTALLPALPPVPELLPATLLERPPTSRRPSAGWRRPMRRSALPTRRSSPT